MKKKKAARNAVNTLLGDWQNTDNYMNCKDAFVAGAEWQKGQMEKESVYLTCCGFHAFSACWSMDNIDTSGYKAGDRVKIVFIEK